MKPLAKADVEPELSIDCPSGYRLRDAHIEHNKVVESGRCEAIPTTYSDGSACGCGVKYGNTRPIDEDRTVQDNPIWVDDQP